MPLFTDRALHPLRPMEGFNRWPATTAAIVICALFGGIALFIPPFMYSDPGFGFLAWRGTLLGHFNSVVSPDPLNIAQDTSVFLTTWSPGQYLVPGMISLAGLPLGVAIIITATAALFTSLLGWISVVRVFSPRAEVALLVTVLIGSFRYSTLPFGIYDGGEILLQAATPWLILAAYSLVGMPFVKAALTAAAAVLVGFLVKLSGIIVVAAALAAGGILVLRRYRSLTPGVIGGFLGAVAAFATVYVTFISKGWNAASVMNWSFPAGALGYAILVPFGAGMSWTDLMGYLFLAPDRPLVARPEMLSLLAFVPTAIVLPLLIWWKAETPKEVDFKAFALLFYLIATLIFVALYVRGADISLEERHFRSVGTVLFVAGIFSALNARSALWLRYSFLGTAAFLALYGLASFSSRAMTMASGRTLDSVSWTNQTIVEPDVINYMRGSYEREGRDAVFLIPSPEIAVTLPKEARVIATQIDFEPLEAVSNRRYEGRVNGKVYVIMEDRVAKSVKGNALLAAFKDYKLSGWQRMQIGNTSIFVQ